jgi:hypothetical protein
LLKISFFYYVFLKRRNKNMSIWNLLHQHVATQNSGNVYAPPPQQVHYSTATPTLHHPPPQPPPPATTTVDTTQIARQVAKEIRKRGGLHGTNPVGRPVGSKKPSNPLDHKGVPNVSYSVAKKIDKAEDLEYLIQKRNQYSRAINLHKKGYVRSTMFRVIIPPNPSVVVGNSPALLTNSSLQYIADGGYEGKDMNPLTRNNMRRDKVQGSSLAPPKLPTSGKDVSFAVAGGAPQGVSSTTRCAPGILETRLAHDVGAVVVEELGPQTRDKVAEVAMETTVQPVGSVIDGAGLVRGGRMSKAMMK